MSDSEFKTLVAELFTAMGLDITIEATQDGDLYLLNLTGSDVRLLERTKDNKTGALITVLKLMAKQRHDVEPRLVIDFYGQRQQRLLNVAQMARKKAETVRIRGEEEEMPPMTAAERRAVHMAIKEMPGVKTESRGVEPHRRIVIVLDEETV